MLTVIYFMIQRQIFHGMKEVKCKIVWYEVNSEDILMIRFCYGEAKSGWLNDIVVTAYMEYITKQSKDHVLHIDSLLMTQHKGNLNGRERYIIDNTLFYHCLCCI